ncbi:MAG TPA: homocitrate synthase family protein [Methanomicrobiales archaeon]|nr:homocitrate synthase family protein [Methanomicrobiales archaeon]
MNAWHVEICDVTLRDGEQTPGVSFTREEKMNIAQLLDTVGVEVIEAGFPITSPYEKQCVAAIAGQGLRARTCCLARARKEDIDAAIDCDVDMVSVFIATSDLHIRTKYRKPREQVLAGALTWVEYAHDHGLQVRFAAEDASRTDPAFLKEVFQEGARHGADLLSFADTVGYLTPLQVRERVAEMVTWMEKPLCVHCHDDLGCASANTITAAEAGAFQLHTTVNGIGERAGNAALEEVLVACRLKGGVERYDLTPIKRLSQVVEAYSRIPVSRTKAIVGDNAFAHESGIHIAAILEDPLTYEFVPPELVGRERRFILGKHSGRHSLEHEVTRLGYNLTDKQICSVLDRVKVYSEHKCTITDEILLELIKNVQKDVQKDGQKVSP